MNQKPILIAAIAFISLASATAISAVQTGAHAGNAAKAQSVVAATEQTITFAVEKMTCGTCPITVRKAMEKVGGVKSVAVDFEAKTATVIFDPAVTTPDQIGAASTNAGYPASPAS
ncbi:MAG: cation transporter [Pseudomonadales bacterium]|nr:cation transporter [Pseudomonadales bacterium]